MYHHASGSSMSAFSPCISIVFFTWQSGFSKSSKVQNVVSLQFLAYKHLFLLLIAFASASFTAGVPMR